jgi:hypothetical protein
MRRGSDRRRVPRRALSASPHLSSHARGVTAVSYSAAGGAPGPFPIASMSHASATVTRFVMRDAQLDVASRLID